MRDRAKELKAEARASKDRAAGERAVLAALAEMPGRIAPKASGSMRSSQPARRPSRPSPGTGVRDACVR
jgi:hypothetical protein